MVSFGVQTFAEQNDDLHRAVTLLPPVDRPATQPYGQQQPNGRKERQLPPSQASAQWTPTGNIDFFLYQPSYFILTI